MGDFAKKLSKGLLGSKNQAKSRRPWSVGPRPMLSQSLITSVVLRHSKMKGKIGRIARATGHPRSFQGFPLVVSQNLSNLTIENQSPSESVFLLAFSIWTRWSRWLCFALRLRGGYGAVTGRGSHMENDRIPSHMEKRPNTKPHRKTAEYRTAAMNDERRSTSDRRRVEDVGGSGGSPCFFSRHHFWLDQQHRSFSVLSALKSGWCRADSADSKFQNSTSFCADVRWSIPPAITSGNVNICECSTLCGSVQVNSSTREPTQFSAEPIRQIRNFKTHIHFAVECSTSNYQCQRECSTLCRTLCRCIRPLASRRTACIGQKRFSKGQALKTARQSYVLQVLVELFA